jgi:hypothetical protein
MRYLLAALLSIPGLAAADRITDMPRTELCVYKAKLSVAGYYWYQQGKPRQEVKIHWHGDETPNEIDFVNQTLDDVYAAADQMKSGPETERVPEHLFGDYVYTACMSGQKL